MDLLKVIILGIVQGLTEFLPISSSGHLVLAERILQMKSEKVAFEVFVHFGTFMSVVVIYKKDIWSMIRALFGSFSSSERDLQSIEFRKLFGLLLLGTVPVVVVGSLFQSLIEKAFTSPLLVSMMLVATGIFLLLTRFSRQKTERIKWVDAILVGFSQAFALLPGISRSGFTIGTGLFLGIAPKKSADFSFLLALPAILGATFLKLFEFFKESPENNLIFSYILGAAFAFLSGYIAIRLLLNLVKKGKFQYFGYYCIIVGISSLLFLL